MTAYTQTQRPLEIITPLGPDVLLIEKLSGREMMSGLFHFQIDMVAEATKEVPFDRLLGQRMTALIRHGAGQVRYFNGICSRLRRGPVIRSGDGPPIIRYHAELVPAFWLWTKHVQSQVFQDCTPLEIFTALVQVLHESLEFSSQQVQSPYRPRPYCVQFQESSFAFLSRLLEEEGIAYYFEHRTDGHCMVLTDRKLQFPALPAPYDAVPFQVEGAKEAITSWEVMQDLAHGYYLVCDHHFELSSPNVEKGKLLSNDVEVAGERYRLFGDQRMEVCEHNGRFAHHFDSIDNHGQENLARLKDVHKETERLAELHTERTGVETLRFAGQSGCAGFAPGYTFATDAPGVKGKYLLTQVEHEARQAPYRSGEGEAFHYENRFDCVPASLPYRPPQRTAPQRIHGTMTATVAGGKPGEVITDKYGRIKVRFHWDRRVILGGQHDSCWIRVMQPWAGKGWGMMHLPRVGQEVVVTFEEGYPDRPLVLGGVYNAACMPPLQLPDHAAVSGIKTHVLAPAEHKDNKPADAPATAEVVPSHPSGVLICDHEDEEVVHIQSAGDIAINATESVRLTVPDQMMTSVKDEMWTSVGWGLPEAKWGGGKLNWTGATVGPAGGERWDLLYGSHITAEGMLANEYTIFSKNEIVIDPTSWAAGLTPFNFLLSGKVPSGRTEAVYGARNTVGFGPYCWTHHGPTINRVASTKPWEKVWAIGHVVASAATCTLPFLYVASANKDLFHVHTDPLIHSIPLFGNSIVGWVDHAAGVCLALGNHFIRDYGVAAAVKDAGSAGLFLSEKMAMNTRLIRPVSFDAANYLAYAAKLPLPNAVIDNRTVEGTSALQADRIQMLAREEGISLLSKGGSTLIYSDRDVAIGSGKCGVLVSDFAGRVDIGVGPFPTADSSVTVEQNGITLSCGANTKMTMTPNSITFKVWDTSFEIGPASVNIKTRIFSVNDSALKLSRAGLFVDAGEFAKINAKVVSLDGSAATSVTGKVVKVG